MIIARTVQTLAIARPQSGEAFGVFQPDGLSNLKNSSNNENSPIHRSSFHCPREYQLLANGDRR